MRHENGRPAAPEDGVAGALEEYLAAVAAGATPPREEFLARHLELAEDLDACLAALRLIGHAARGPLSAVGGGEVLSSAGPDGGPVSGLLGDFRIVREVGRGGMGVVYEAEQVSLGRRVALKVLPFAATMDPRALQRFQNEARAAASLDHPHIVHVHAVGCERGVHYYAMQFIDGQTLAALIADLRRAGGRPVAPEAQATTPHVPGEAEPAADTAPQAAASTERTRLDRAHYRPVAELGIQAAEALDHAHQLGIVHRDVKPANLLVDERGGLWVTDFGLAHIQSDARLTMTGDLVGTLRYMSPEQALAKRVVVDHRTDVYSLGATLYELLTLEPAFRGNDRQELLRQIAFEEPAPPRRINRAIPAELETIVLKAMEKNPQERYATAKDLANDLRRWLADEPIRAKRPGLVACGRKWARRHQAVVWSTVLVALVLAASVGWVLGDRSARRREAEGKAVQALDEAGLRLPQGNPWDPALTSAAQRAEMQLDSGLLGRDSRRRVEQLQKDMQMLAELERIRLARAGVRDEQFDQVAEAVQYRDAFRNFGIDVKALGPDEAAARVKDSAIREPLVAGLDDWASELLAFREDEERQAAQRLLLAVARQADPDPWRNRLRELPFTEGAIALSDLVRTAPVEELPAATLGLLGHWVHSAAAQPEARISGPTLDVLRRAQRQFPADFWINHNLGVALAHAEPPQLEEAIGYYRVAVALRPQSPGAHLNLGNALYDKRRTDEAVAEYREAIRLKPDYAAPHNNLGTDLEDKGQTDGAIAEFREALRINKDVPESYCGLGLALQQSGQFAEALETLRHGHELGTKRPGRHLPTAAQVKDCEYLVEVQRKLPAFLKGEARPADAAECLALARICQAANQKRYATAVRWYGEAFVARPALAEKDIDAGPRYDAACAAALAGCSQGQDAGGLDDKQRARLRGQALAWLQADLNANRRLWDKEPDKTRPAAMLMRHWLDDPDFNGVRGPDALAKLPEAERQDWQKLWADVAATLTHAQEKTAPK